MADYIHTREDWPRFRWNQDALSRQLAAVRHRQGRLIGRMEGVGFQPRDEAVLRSLTEEAVKSHKIEGEILDREQVRSSIASDMGIDIGALKPADRRVEGVVDTMIDAARHYMAPLTEARLFA